MLDTPKDLSHQVRLASAWKDSEAAYEVSNLERRRGWSQKVVFKVVTSHNSMLLVRHRCADLRPAAGVSLQVPVANDTGSGECFRFYPHIFLVLDPRKSCVLLSLVVELGDLLR